LKLRIFFLQTALDFVSAAINHPDSSVRERSRDLFLKTLEYTSICGGKHMSALPGAFFDEESKEASFNRCCEELVWRTGKAKEYGIVFSVEAHIGSIVPTPSDALRMVKKVPGLTLTLDYSHFAYQGIPDAEVEPLMPHASHFHARSAAQGKVQTVLQESSIDFKRVVHVMKDAGYKGFIGLEYNWTDWEGCNRTDNISETILLRDLIRKAE